MYDVISTHRFYCNYNDQGSMERLESDRTVHIQLLNPWGVRPVVPQRMALRPDKAAYHRVLWTLKSGHSVKN